MSTFKVKTISQPVEFSEGDRNSFVCKRKLRFVIEWSLALNALGWCEVPPDRKNFLDCLGTNSLLLLLHCADWEFQTGALLFHDFIEIHRFFSVTRNSFQFFVRHARLCNSAFSGFVPLPRIE